MNQRGHLRIPSFQRLRYAGKVVRRAGHILGRLHYGIRARHILGRVHHGIQMGYNIVRSCCRKRARGFHTDDGPDSTGAVEEETFERPVKRQRTTSIGIVARAASTHFARTPQPVSGYLPLAAESTALPSAVPSAAPVAAPSAAPVPAPVAAPVAAPSAAWRQSNTLLTMGRPPSDRRTAKPAWGPDYSAKTSLSANKSSPSWRRNMSRPYRYTVHRTAVQQHDPQQASRGTLPPAAAGGNPVLPAPYQQRVQPTSRDAQQYAFRDPRMQNVTKTLQAVGARHAAAYVSKLHAQEAGTAATLEDVAPSSSMGPNQLSTAVGPAQGSVGDLVSLSTFERTAAGSLVACGEDRARQVTHRLDHQDDTMPGQEPRLGELRPADVPMHATEKDMGAKHAISSNPFEAASREGAEVAQAEFTHNPELTGSNPVFWAAGQAEPQETTPGMEQVNAGVSGQQARPEVVRPAEISTYVSSKVVEVQPLDALSAPVIRHDGALYEEAWSSPPQPGNLTGALSALQSYKQPNPHVLPQSRPPLTLQLRPEPSLTPDLAALSEQEPSPDSLQPSNRSAEPEAAATLQTVSRISSNFDGAGDNSCGDGSHGGGDDDRNAGDGNDYRSSGSIIDCAYSGVGSAGGGTGASSGGASSGGASSGGASGGGASSGSGGASSDGGGSHVGEGAAAESALPPFPPADGGDSSPAGGSDDGIAGELGDWDSDVNGDGNGGAHGEPSAGNTANLTAQKLKTGEVSILDFNSQLQQAAATQAQERVWGEEGGAGQGIGMQAADQDLIPVVSPSAKEEASCFLAELGLEFCVEEAAPGAGNASQGVGGTPIGGSSAETRLQAGVHMKRHHINMECDDPAPDADMEEDEYADYELEDDSYAAPSSWHGTDVRFAHASFTPGIAPGPPPAWTPPSAFPPPAATAGSTWMPPGTPSQHAAFGMPHIPLPQPTMYNGYAQMAAPGHGSWSCQSGCEHQPWEQGQIQTPSGKKRKNQERSHGQKRIKSRGTTSNAQQGSAQPASLAWGGNAKLGAVANSMQGSTETLAWRGNAKLDAVATARQASKETLVWRREPLLAAAANAMQKSTAVGTDSAVAATAGGEAKQAAGSIAAEPTAATAAAHGEPSANVDGFARSSFGNTPVQAAARHGGVQSTYKFSLLF